IELVIALEEAQQRILAAVAPLPPRAVALADARGLVLARAVMASEMVPPFANTAMDGFAVRAADTAGASESTPTTLRIVGEVAAGDPGTLVVGSPSDGQD